MKLSRWPIFLLALAAGSLVSCQAAKNVPAALVYSSLHCPLHDAGIYSISSHIDLNKIFTNIKSNSIGSTLQKPPEVDFTAQQIFLVSLGTKPSSGYRLFLEDSSAVYQNGILELPVRVIEPEKNTMQAQVITTPCVLISVPKNHYQKVIVSGNDTLAEIDIK